MNHNLIDKVRLNEKFNSITVEQNKAKRHKKLQDKFVKEYARFKKKLKTVKTKKRSDKPPKKISTIKKIPSCNHEFADSQKKADKNYTTLKAIAKIVGVKFK